MATATQIATEFATALNEKFDLYEITVEPGRVYDKIVQASIFNGVVGARSIHAFVRRSNGDLLKAAGWNAPAKGERGNLLTPEEFSAIVNKADQYGSYLYKR